jgi:hypothetical protein
MRQFPHVTWRRPEVRFELAHAAFQLGAKPRAYLDGLAWVVCGKSVCNHVNSLLWFMWPGSALARHRQADFTPR